MLSTLRFLGYLSEHNFGPYVGVPCSFLKPFINYAIDCLELDYIAANNEGEAIAIAAGAYLAGRKPVVMFQNSGLGNAVNPLTSLTYVFRIPLLLITTWRGEPGLRDAPQHELMGMVTPSLLDLLHIKHDLFPRDDAQIEPKMKRAMEHLEESKLPYAFIMSKGVVTPYDLDETLSKEDRRPAGQILESEPMYEELMLRGEAVVIIADAADERTALVATTGKTARELAAYRDRAKNFYVIGSMGCAASLALGVALYTPGRPVIVLDGDGAALMRLEAMASIGHYQPSNLIHVILDNEVYESTGGQRTLSSGVYFPELAVACSYRTAVSTASSEGLQKFLATAIKTEGPHLIHLRIRPGSDPDLGRPSLPPPELAARFRQAVCSKG